MSMEQNSVSCKPADADAGWIAESQRNVRQFLPKDELGTAVEVPFLSAGTVEVLGPFAM